MSAGVTKKEVARGDQSFAEGGSKTDVVVQKADEFM